MKDTKEHILHVSLQLFLQKNFKEVTMKEIVEKTGLSKGAFYHYFSSKEQVFEEVINHFYTELLSTDFNQISAGSLQDFYTGLIKQRNQKDAASKLILVSNNLENDSAFASNHYFLIFDAIRMLPHFNALRIKQKEEEKKAWLKMIQAAKKSGEITTRMPDDKLAKLFIYSGKGIGLESVMGGSFDHSRKEIKELWDSLYKQIKTI